MIKIKFLPYSFRRRITNFDVASGVFKINLAVNQLPNFKAYPTDASGKPGPNHMGTIHFEETLEELDDAYKDAAAGRPSKKPIIEMTIPSSVDKTVAPNGGHVVQLFCQHAPYKLANGSWSDPSTKEAFANRVFSVIEEYAPGFKKSIIGKDILSPLDLENIFDLPNGNIFHGAMGLDQLYWARPAFGFARHRSPVKNLYMCGAGCSPGGGVMGAAGRNCSTILLADAKEKSGSFFPNILSNITAKKPNH